MNKLIVQGLIGITLAASAFGMILTITPQSVQANAWTHGASGGGSYCNSSHCMTW